MASEYSFDVVSDFEHAELTTALDQLRRELQSRYDFRDVPAEVTEEKGELIFVSDSEMHLKAMLDILQSKFHKRGLDLKILDAQKPQPAAKGNLRQAIKLRKGINDELSRELNKRIRATHPKIQVRIQGDQLRVSGRDKDELQAVMAELRAMDLEVPLQFTNYR